MGLQLNEQGEWEHTEKSHTTQKRATNECYVTQIRAKKRPLALAVRLQQYQGLVWRGVYDGLKHILQSFSPSSAPRPEYQDLLCSPHGSVGHTIQVQARAPSQLSFTL